MHTHMQGHMPCHHRIELRNNGRWHSLRCADSRVLVPARVLGIEEKRNMLLHVLLIIGAPVVCSALNFEPPSIAGSTGFPSDFQGLGERYVLGRNGDDGWRGSADGGKTWDPVLEGERVEGDAPGYHAVVLAAPGALHNMGNITNVADRDARYTSFHSDFVQVFQVQAGVFSTHSLTRNVSFQGLPYPVSCGSGAHLFGCPFRTDGIGHVKLPDGSLVMSIVVYWGGAHASTNKTVRDVATSVVAFRSHDGYSWQYAGTILDAAGLPTSEEGPNQNDIVLLADNRTLMCVMRVDSGEGPSMRYTPLVRSFSSDGGSTWSRPESFGEGFATGHPRLTRMGDGQILLSGNQLTPTDRDLLLYWNEAGDGQTWQPHSVSYWHNALEADGSLHFTAAVNNSPAVPRHGEITGLSSLISTEAQSGVLLYSRTIYNKSLTFAMCFQVPPRRQHPNKTHLDLKLAL